MQTPSQRSPIYLSQLVRCALAATVAAAAPAIAEQRGESARADSSLSLGIALMSRQQAYTDIDRDNKAFPMLQYENAHVRVFGPGIGIKLPAIEVSATERVSFSIVGRYDGSGYEADDAPVLSGMDERRGGFWAGARTDWRSSSFGASAEVLADASGRSKGRRLSLALEKTWRLGQRTLLTPRVGASWQDENAIDYYYGVRSAEARPGRPAYTGKAGTNGELGLRLVHLIERQHSLFADIEVASLASSIKDSPLVDQSTENRVLLGYSYRFR